MEVTTKILDHHGIVAATCREVGLVEIIDREITPDQREKLTTGECVLAMILNGLGFTTKPLYITPMFFQNKCLELLIKSGIEATDLNDDKLGRTLDKLYEHGCDKLFSRLSYHITDIFKVNTKFQHLDTTVMSVSGVYENAGGAEDVLITYGRPKDGVQNSKQYLISLMVSNDGGIPLLSKCLPGNKADQTHFRETLKTLKNEMKENKNQDFYYVMDGAFYSETNVKEVEKEGKQKFITHVPSRLTEVQELKKIAQKDQMRDLKNGYKVSEVKSNYGEVEQRWIIVFSDKAYGRECKILRHKIKKENEELNKELKRLSHQVFSCKEDAIKTIDKLNKKANFNHIKDYQFEEIQLTQGRGKKKTAIIEYKINSVGIAFCKSKIKEAKRQIGIFVLATNELDEKKLTQEEMLSYYKGQDRVEKGFRFLKNPLCMAEAVFLKNQQRIVALSMVMCLCLLIYSIAQRKLRKALEAKDETLPDQRGKKSKKLTMKWIYQLFEGIHVAYIRLQGNLTKQITNLQDIHKQILKLLGHQYEQIYSIPMVTCGM